MGNFLYIFEVSDTTLSSQLGRRMAHSLVLPASWALVEDLSVAMAEAILGNGFSLYSTLLGSRKSTEVKISASRSGW